MMTDIKYPNLNYEVGREIYRDRYIAGVDEVGRGSWAGPVSVGIVVLDLKDLGASKKLLESDLDDSKKLSPKKRSEMYKLIESTVTDFAVGHSNSDICDQFGMTFAIQAAAVNAIDQLSVKPDHYLVDGICDLVPNALQTCIPKGDSICISIAAASVVAKVTRDKMMQQLEESYPGYDFFHNKGYPSKTHIRSLRQLGPCEIHRTSWRFMENISHYEC